MYKTVTKNGRSLGPGTATRRSLAVRRSHRKMERPLPFVLQCHPIALRPTTRNPDCRAYYPASGPHTALLRAFKADYSLIWAGHRLSGSGSATLYVQGDGQSATFHHDDPAFALGWKRAAEAMGLQCELTL